MDDAATMDDVPDTPQRKRKRRWAKRLGWAIVILFAPIALVGAFLATPIGKRFVADQIAAAAPASGLRFTVGRIEGDLFNSATVYDVTAYDPQGAFLTIPEARLRWRPLNWLWSGLDVRELTVKRGTLERLPELLPGDPDAPILPDFDIRVDKLAIENLTLAGGVAGEDPQRVDMNAEVDIRSGRALIDAEATLGKGDRFDLLLDAEPDGDQFDLALDAAAPIGGVIANLAGLRDGFTAQIAGEGTWTNWLGHALVLRQPDGAVRAGEELDAANDRPFPPTRVAAFQLTNEAGRYGLLGQVSAVANDGTIIGRALGDALSIALTGTLEESVFDGKLAAVSDALDLRGGGVADFADNAFDTFRTSLVLRDPDLLGENARLEGARLDATLTGRFSDLAIPHRLTADALDLGFARIEQIEQESNATLIDGAFILALNATTRRVITGQDLIDPRLQGGLLRGRLTYRDGLLTADQARLSFPGLGANLSLRGDVSRGRYAIDGPVRADQITIPDVGELSGVAEIEVVFGTQVPWSLDAQLEGDVGSVSNATLANVIGEQLAFDGGFAMGADQPLSLQDVSVESERLTGEFDSAILDGVTTLSGEGRHVDYGPFVVEAEISGTGPVAELVLADPLPAAGLRDVRVSLAPSEDGFALDVAGQSLLGEFDGDLGITLPEDGPAQLAIDRLQVYRTRVSGALAFEPDGLTGDLALSGGGLDGTIGIQPLERGATGFAIDLEANQARFGGETAIALASADIDLSGQFGGEAPTQISGEASGAGLQYGALSIARFSARADVTDGRGDIVASIAGDRADRFALKLDGDIAPDRIALLARGSYGGRAITMPRRAVLTPADGGGWSLAPTQIGFARGFAIVEGEAGGATTRLSARLARMPLRLADIAGADLGLSGRLSGTLAYSQSAGEAPTARARLQVDNFARSGLVLSSQPIDLTAGLDLDGQSLRAAATFDTDDARLGRLDAQVTGLAGQGALADRIGRGRLTARLTYNGAAEALWRLAAIETFDLTGPLAVEARATGTLNNPRITGQLASDDLRVQSAISGTDISNVTARGRFEGSELAITRFAGETPGGGTITGSGTVDLSGISADRGPRIDLRAAAKRARLLNAAGLDATLTGPLRIVSNGVGGTIAGRVEIDRASWRLGYAAEDMALPDITTREINLPNQTQERTQAASAGSWRYLVDARAPSRIAVDGLGLDSEWGIDIVLRGTVDDPRLGGEARLVRGAYSFAGTRFDLTRGRIRFDENQPIDPRLDIDAETSTGDFNVTIDITGNAQTPEITFSSQPPLPEEEILAQLLFGGSVTSLSATDAVQLGAALAALRGGDGGLDPIGQLRQSIGLDQLRFVSADPAIGRSTGVALGKNLGRKFYVEIVTDGRGYSATQVEYRVTRWLALLGTVTTIGRDRVSAEISRDY